MPLSSAAALPLDHAFDAHAYDAPREAAFRRARAHSRVVRVLKWVLPMLGLTVAGGFGVAAWQAAPVEAPVTAEGAAVAEGRLVMANPTMGGVTDDDLPYSMNALRAIQEIGREDIVELEAINAALPIDTEDTATITADGGTYNRDANTLQLKSAEGGTIGITTTSGMTARARSALIDISAGSMQAEGAVAVTTDKAHLTADTLAVQDGGQILVFERNVRMTIEPGGLGVAEKGDGDANL